MEENLVGYLLDSLDDATKREVEAQLQASPEARQQLSRLRRALEPLEADKELPAPPADLVVRTLARVAEHICEGHELPRAPTLKFETPAPRRWWRRADVLIAASVLLLALGGALPALMTLRTSNTVLACQNNLRQFYVALQSYRDQHAGYPSFDRIEEPRNVAGMVVPILAEAGVLPRHASIRCPGNGAPLTCKLSLGELQSMDLEDFERYAPQLSLSYAYSLGYRDESGAYHSPGLNPHLPGSLIPLMGDRALAEDPRANSGNHGGTGQNILYSDGRARFHPTRTIAGDDLYLNLRNEVAAGLGASDAVLGASAARP
jgi:hypothetical protein